MRWVLLLALTACADHRGEAGEPCKPDGTCIGLHLRCVESPTWAGVDVYMTPICRVKE